MMDAQVKEVAKHFGFNPVSIESLTEGLIHKTYKVVFEDGRIIILQQINTTVFTEPKKITRNYQQLCEHLSNHDGLKIPGIRKTTKNTELYDDGKFCWRAFEYITHSYTENLPTTKEKIFSTAQCYGVFVRSLSGMDASSLQPTIAGFHDLNGRYIQLQQAIQSATQTRLANSKTWIEKIEDRKSLVNFYNAIIQNPEFRKRAMHHDCKLSNILFDSRNQQAICPIDLDTVMPGYFFSDVGDMVRSMVSETEEDSPAEKILIRKDYYEVIMNGYRLGIGDTFTQTELDHMHHVGLIMIYMQGIRFLTDYLSNDVYYKISYPMQNFDRAVNQLTLLEKLQEFLETDYQYKIS
ncbi:MAG TPA: aminoglycoside phosphotransferase family protein [Cyclobacteriaceae bacterium]|nr:aminoglycoside phosphotransferase family protein [Cyclobacteriaceae bacterium]